MTSTRVSSLYGAPATPISLDEFHADSGSVLVGSYAGAMSSSSPDAASDMKWDAIVVTSAHMVGISPHTTHTGTRTNPAPPPPPSPSEPRACPRQAAAAAAAQRRL